MPCSSSFPAGICDAEGEDPQVTAARELQEEVELQAEHWRLPAHALPTAGISSELHHLYLARGLSHSDRGDFELHAEEAELEVLWVAFDDLLDAVLAAAGARGSARRPPSWRTRCSVAAASSDHGCGPDRSFCGKNAGSDTHPEEQRERQ